jgi:hypothetical protein
VPVPTPRVFAVLRIPAPVANCSRMHSTTFSPTRRRPRRFPWLRAREARLHALDYNAALELGKDAEHLKHRPSRWGTGVETLLMKVKIDTLGVRFTKERDQLLQRASEPVGHRTAIANIIVEERIE